MDIILSILLGMLPEVLYITLFIIFAKDLKNKRIILFILNSIAYMIFIMFNNYKVLNYIIYILLLFGILKLLYREKTQVIDIFLINISIIIIAIVSSICYFFVKDNMEYYIIAAIINRIILLLQLFGKNIIRKLYINYCKLWNRSKDSKEKRPIKSITLRNVSLISINIFVFLCDIVFLYILQK